MNRLSSIALAVSLAACLPAPLASSPAIGTSLEAVLAEKGPPTGRAGVGAMVLLNYPDETIVLKDGKVTEVRPNGEVSTVPDRKITEADRRRAAADQAAAAASASQASWTTEYQTALTAARAQNRKVFLFFTGSDWCGWCIKLNREILSRPEFAAYAADNLVLVELDFPRNKSIAQDLRARNTDLARKYGVRGFPTVIVLSPNGSVLGKLGYQDGGPGPFIEALKRL